MGYTVRYAEERGRIKARATVQLIDGSRQRFSGNGKNKQEAAENLQKKIEEKNREIEYGQKAERGDITLAEAVRDLIEERRTEYSREKDREARRDSTVKRDEESLESLIKPHGISRKRLSEIMPRDCQEYRDWLERATYTKGKRKHYSASTLNRAQSLVRTAINRFYRHSPKKSPADILTRFRGSTAAKKGSDFLMGEEVKTFLRYLDQVREEKRYRLDALYADIFAICLMTALRPGEARGLKAKDWDPEDMTLTIRRTGSREDGRTKTEESRRTIPVVEAAAEILNRRAEGRRPEEYIFSPDGKKILDNRNGTDKLKRWIREAGIEKDLHWHSLRGSAGSYMLDHDIPLEDVSVLMGHANTNTTRRYYISYTEERKRRAIRKMNGAF